MTTASSMIAPAAMSLTAPATTPTGKPQNLEQIKATSKEFEATFLSQMLGHMFEGIGTDPMFGGGEGENMFRSMLTDQYGKQMASVQGIGISDQLQKAMLKMQQG